MCAPRQGAGTRGLAGAQVAGGRVPASTTPVSAGLPPLSWLSGPGDCRPKTPRPRASPGRGGEGGGVEGGGSRRKARAVRPREAARAPAGPASLALGDRGRGSVGPRPARPGEGESPAAAAPPRALPRRPEPGAGRGRSRRCLGADPLSPRSPVAWPLVSPPGAEARARGGRARVCAAREAGAQRRAAGAGVRRAAEEGRRLMNINRAAA